MCASPPSTRTRGGGSIIHPKHVTLHGNDFSYDERLRSMSDLDRKEMIAYSVLLMESLRTPIQFKHPSYTTTRDVRDGWEQHYACNRHHFPIKNYILHAFPALGALKGWQGERKYILECGCGTGSALLPLIKYLGDDDIHFVGFDISSQALNYLRQHDIARSALTSNKLHFFTFGKRWSQEDTDFHLDIADCPGNEDDDGQVRKVARTEGEMPLVDQLQCILSLNLGTVRFDYVLLVFVLSALPGVSLMKRALHEIHQVIRPGGLLLFRDYDVADYTFARQRKRAGAPLSDLCIYKGDGTVEVFFTREFIVSLMEQCGFECAAGEGHLTHHCNRLINRKTGMHMDKVFLNGTFFAV